MTLSWTFHGSKISSDLGITTVPIGSRGTMLIISSVGYQHNGLFTCTATNQAGQKSTSADLKVNGNQIKNIYMEGTDVFLSFRTP